MPHTICLPNRDYMPYLLNNKLLIEKVNLTRRTFYQIRTFQKNPFHLFAKVPYIKQYMKWEGSADLISMFEELGYRAEYEYLVELVTKGETLMFCDDVRDLIYLLDFLMLPEDRDLLIDAFREVYPYSLYEIIPNLLPTCAAYDASPEVMEEKLKQYDPKMTTCRTCRTRTEKCSNMEILIHNASFHFPIPENILSMMHYTELIPFIPQIRYRGLDYLLERRLDMLENTGVAFINMYPHMAPSYLEYFQKLKPTLATGLMKEFVFSDLQDKIQWPDIIG